MLDSEFIKRIEAIDFEKYSTVSSREKLVVYTIDYLGKHNIETNWTNVCIASFKLFPEKFYLSEEYKEYPAIERLNRTLLHLRPKEQNYAIGSPSVNYVLTPLGREVAFQVSTAIEKGTSDKKLKMNILEKNQHTQANDYFSFINHPTYQKAQQGSIGKLDFIWEYFEVTPFTQKERIKKKLQNIKEYASSKDDIKCIELIDTIQRSI